MNRNLLAGIYLSRISWSKLHLELYSEIIAVFVDTIYILVAMIYNTLYISVETQCSNEHNYSRLIRNSLSNEINSNKRQANEHESIEHQPEGKSHNPQISKNQTPHNIDAIAATEVQNHHSGQIVAITKGTPVSIVVGERRCSKMLSSGDVDLAHCDQCEVQKSLASSSDLKCTVARKLSKVGPIPEAEI